MMGKKHVELPCGQSSFFSTPENMLADAAMRGICEAAPDVLIHKNLACSYCEGAMTPEKRFSISVADPWCEGSSSQITMPEKLVFLKETYQGLGLDILGIVKGFLDAQSYITVNGMIPTEEGKVGEQTCLITGYDDFKQILTIYYRDDSVQLKRLDFPYSKSESFFYGTKEDEILFLTWAFNPGTLYTLPSASRLVFEFADYTLSQNKRFQSTVGYVYGFEAMERLREEVTSLCRAGKPLPLAYVSQYSYHKHKMAQRIERLNECSYLSPAFRNMPEIIETLAQEFDQAVDTYAEKPSQNTAQAVELSMLAIEKMEKENYPGIWWSLKVVNHNLNCSESAIQKFFAKRKKV